MRQTDKHNIKQKRHTTLKHCIGSDNNLNTIDGNQHANSTFARSLLSAARFPTQCPLKKIAYSRQRKKFSQIQYLFGTMNIFREI